MAISLEELLNDGYVVKRCDWKHSNFTWRDLDVLWIVTYYKHMWYYSINGKIMIKWISERLFKIILLWNLIISMKIIRRYQFTWIQLPRQIVTHGKPTKTVLVNINYLKLKSIFIMTSFKMHACKGCRQTTTCMIRKRWNDGPSDNIPSSTMRWISVLLQSTRHLRTKFRWCINYARKLAKAQK